MTPRSKYFPYHVLLFSVSPILALFAHNIRQLEADLLVRPSALSLAGAIILWGVLCAVFRDTRRAGIVASLVIVPFFGAGHIGAAWPGNGFAFAAFYVAWIAVLAVAVVLLIRSRSDLRQLTAIFNVAALVFFVMPVAQIVIFELRNATVTDIAAEGGDEEGAGVTGPEGLPNIYYILLDGYAREDVLKYLHNYDNGEFLDGLSRRGFFIADQSCSNYPHTMQTIASLLNLNYIHNLMKNAFDEVPRDERALFRLFTQNRAAKILRRRGYSYVGFDTGFWSLDHANVDIPLRSGGGFSLFENQLINTTPLASVVNRLPMEGQYGQHRRRMLYTLDHLGDTTSLRGPLFVFAHILAAHPPFVFNSDGTPFNPEHPFTFVFQGDHAEYRVRYAAQVEFINGKLLDAIDAILAGSDKEPVIIISGDHGSRMLFNSRSAAHANVSECFPILNAYYLPHGGDRQLYESISPVNSFRLVFNEYLGTKFRLLDDKCFYSTREDRLKFTLIDRRRIRPSKEAFPRIPKD